MGERLEIANKYINKNYPLLKVLKYCEIPSSTYYDYIKVKVNNNPISPKGRPVPGFSINLKGLVVLDSSIVSIIKNYRKQLNFMNSGGHRILKEYLKRDHQIIVNHKKLYRICKKHKLLLPKNIKKIKINKKIAANRKIIKPNQLWQFDIKTGFIHGENKYFYLLAIIDIFNRKVINHYIGYNCKAKNLKVTFEEALIKENIITDKKLSNLVIRSDNGPQMTSYMFNKYVDSIGLEHEFTPVKTPNKNAFVESFFSIYETQFLQVRYFDSLLNVYSQTDEYINYYNNERLHGSLFNLPPIEFTNNFNNGKYIDLQISA